MYIVKITDRLDPRIEVYGNLKDKQLSREQIFMIEGKFILETLLTRSVFSILSVFIAEDRLLPLETVLCKVPKGVPIYVTRPEIMAEIAGFNVHRGILAAGVAHRLENNLPDFLAGKSRIAVLSNVSNPDNIGSIFRNAAGLGFEAVLLDEQCCSPLYRKAIRVSMGATLVLPWLQTGSIENIIGHVAAKGFRNYALSLQGETHLADVRFAAKSAFVFGEEAHGLPPAVQSLCEAVTIPMAAGTDSLNVAATSAIVFDAFRRQQI